MNGLQVKNSLEMKPKMISYRGSGGCRTPSGTNALYCVVVVGESRFKPDFPKWIHSESDRFLRDKDMRVGWMAQVYPNSANRHDNRGIFIFCNARACLGD